MNRLFSLALILLLSGCTLRPLLCFVDLSGNEKNSEFSVSKEALKDKILDEYSYNRSLLAKNFGATLIHDERVNANYLRSVDSWLFKSNWDLVEREIRDEMEDTLNLMITKHFSRTKVKFKAVVQGDDSSSVMTISDVSFEKVSMCKRTKEEQAKRAWRRINKKFIGKLK